MREIDEAFARLVEQRANAVMVAGPFYATRAVQLAMLAARHGLPMTAAPRAFPVPGALIGYGTSTADAYRRAGLLTGRLLKGATPAETPVDRATKFEFVINLATARNVGITVPPSLLARADEVRVFGAAQALSAARLSRRTTHLARRPASYRLPALSMPREAAHQPLIDARRSPFAARLTPATMPALFSLSHTPSYEARPLKSSAPPRSA